MNAGKISGIRTAWFGHLQFIYVKAVFRTSSFWMPVALKSHMPFQRGNGMWDILGEQCPQLESNRLPFVKVEDFHPKEVGVLVPEQVKIGHVQAVFGHEIIH